MFQLNKAISGFEIMSRGKWLIILLCSVFSISKTIAQVGISSSSITPDASSILELRSTTAGFLPPRMTTTQRDAITTPASGLLIYNSSTNQLNYYTGSTWQIVSAGASGTVTSASVTTANGFSGTVATSTTTPAITISTSVNGIAKGNGTELTNAIMGTDYSAGTSSLGTGILKSTTSTGTLSIATPADFPTLNQNTTGNAATVTTNANLTGDVTSIGNATTLATVNSNIGTFNSVTVNAKGLVTAATLSTTEVTGKLNSDANSTYGDNTNYWGRVVIADGFPVTGILSGTRKGTNHTQRIQSETGDRTFSRYWIDASTAWSSWIEYIQKDDFTAKGALLAGTGISTSAVITPGINGTALFADNSTATGLKWALAENIVELGTDVINNNATANTIQDVTGLSFPVTAGVTYRFSAMILYTSAATTTGSRWSISGPASPTVLSYKTYYPITATTETTNYSSSYDLPAAANASSLLTGNIATIDGIIRPSVNGSVTVRFASEIANSAITAKAGSTIKWW